MSGSLGVMSVILLEVAVGGAVVLWATGVWGHVRRGFFILSGVFLAMCAAGSWALARNLAGRGGQGADEALQALGGAAGGRVVTSLALFTGLLVVWQVLLLVRQPRASQVVGLAAAAVGVASLVLFGLLREPTQLRAIAELALGAVFLGSAFHGLLLGHWYLVERRLSNSHMVRTAWWYIGGVVAAVGAVVLSALNPAAPTLGFNPLLAAPGFSVFLAAGLVAICALIAGFVWKLAGEGGRSIQAATGMFYLAVIMAFSAELSTKVRFF